MLYDLQVKKKNKKNQEYSFHMVSDLLILVPSLRGKYVHCPAKLS